MWKQTHFGIYSQSLHSNLRDWSLLKETFVIVKCAFKVETYFGIYTQLLHYIAYWLEFQRLLPPQLGKEPFIFCTYVALFLQLILSWIHKHCTHNNQLILDWMEDIPKFWIALFSYMIEPIG